MAHLATNQYPWGTFYRREGRQFEADLDAGLGQVAACGLDGFEPIVGSPDQVDQLAPLLEKHGLEMRSLYVNTTLHEPEQAEESIAHVLAIARRAKQAGTRIVVTNPNPLRWGGQEGKDDVQLETQATALGRLGRELAGLGLTLAYHNHDAELRHAAREFHHMMIATEPEAVALCLDAHWIFRGAGDSALAVYDVVELYGTRVRELHLRQSAHGAWTESFGEGDIDYARIAARLADLGAKPHLVLEQAVEQASPATLDAVAAHRRSCESARRLFAPFEV
ncbi:MAG: sugar phosphate isomerase/epimerase family protein [Candidatus Brocadiia bacterium]